ncbi:hypothetical protein TNCV_987771 [Trichonephila clavipes]|nr:hypothetical protein TNCV_987771 [Trichonephila clavipes]
MLDVLDCITEARTLVSRRQVEAFQIGFKVSMPSYKLVLLNLWPPSGHGHELMSSVVKWRIRSLVLLKTHSAERVLLVKSVNAENSPLGVV